MSSQLSAEQIREQQWVSRYVAGKLSEPEIEAFEIYCIEHPELVAEVELDQRMKSALAIVTIPAQKAPAPRRLAPQWAWAAAAGILLVLGAAVMLNGRGSRQAQHAPILAAVERGDTRPVIETFRLAQTRGTQLPSLGTAADGFVKVRLVGAFDPAAHYDVALNATDADAGSRIITRLAQQPVANGELHVLLNTADLPRGTYALVTVGPTGSPTMEFEFAKN